MRENETNSLRKTKTLVGMAIFTAIVVVLQLMAGVIKIGTFSPSLVLIPIVIGTAVYGIKAGAWLGFVFGVLRPALGWALSSAWWCSSPASPARTRAAT